MAASISFICYITNWILSEKETFSVQIIRSLGWDPSNIEDRAGVIDVVLVFLVLTLNMLYSFICLFRWIWAHFLKTPISKYLSKQEINALCYHHERCSSVSWANIYLHPAVIYILRVHNRNTRTRCEICSKLTIKTPERRRVFPTLCFYC